MTNQLQMHEIHNLLHFHSRVRKILNFKDRFLYHIFPDQIFAHINNKHPTYSPTMKIQDELLINYFSIANLSPFFSWWQQTGLFAENINQLLDIKINHKTTFNNLNW